MDACTIHDKVLFYLHPWILLGKHNFCDRLSQAALQEAENGLTDFFSFMLLELFLYHCYIFIMLSFPMLYKTSTEVQYSVARLHWPLFSPSCLFQLLCATLLNVLFPFLRLLQHLLLLLLLAHIVPPSQLYLQGNLFLPNAELPIGHPNNQEVSQ